MTKSIFTSMYRYIFITILWSICSITSWAQNPLLSSSVDSNCMLHLVLTDTFTNQPVSNHPPYIFIVGNSSSSSTSLAMANIDLSTFTNGTYTITAIDGLQNTYNGVVTIGCGQSANGGNAFVLIDTSTDATVCAQCNGVGAVLVSNPNSIYTFHWSNGFVETTNGASQQSNICPGVYTVVVTDDSTGATSSILATIGCNNGTAAQTASCVSQFQIDLSANSTLLFPQDLSSIPISQNTQAYIVDPLGNIHNFYSLTCNDLGYNNFTLLFVDAVLQTSTTCQVVVRVNDSLGLCNGQNSNHFQFIGTSTNSPLCTTCAGMYFFQTVVDTLNNNTTMPGPYTYLWSDGVTAGPTRTGLCPNQVYTLTVVDVNGNSYIENITVGCNTPVFITCIDSSRIISNVSCPTTYAPVCGCDSVTYLNACVAEFQHGIANWTQGACGWNNLVLIANTTPANFCDTVTPCNGIATIAVVGGTAPYTIAWSNGGTTFSDSAICAGTYTVLVADANGNTATALVVVGITGCVWPGDTDDNTVANNFDLLPIALAYNDAGSPRQNATIVWAAQAAEDWPINPISGLSNHKHIDCDGNAVIDSMDVFAISQNYGSTYFRSSSSLFGPAPFFVTSGTANPNDTLSLDIHLGDQVNSISNAYAVAFTINYNPAAIEGISADFTNSWLGNDLLEIQKNFTATGTLELAIGRKDKAPISGYGPIGSISFTIKDDVLIGKNQMDSVAAPFSISTIRLINELNAEIGTNPQTGTVVISNFVSIHKIDNELDILLFPNPTESILNIQSKSANIEAIQLFTATGQLVLSVTNPDARFNRIQTEDLPQGVYFIAIQTDKGVYNNRLQIIK